MTDQALLTPPQVTDQLTKLKATVIIDPQAIRVIKRNGKVAHYDQNKINSAITQAFLAVTNEAISKEQINLIVEELTQQITDTFCQRLKDNQVIHIEDIQDQIELALMRAEQYQVAKAFVLYRDEHRKQREQQVNNSPSLKITFPDGSQHPLNEKYLYSLVEEACNNITETSVDVILTEVKRRLFDGITLNEVNQALVDSALSLTTKTSQYELVATKLLLNKLRSQALSFLGLGFQLTNEEMSKLYSAYFQAYIHKGIKLKLLSPKLKQFDLDKLAQALKPEKDLLLSFKGLQELYHHCFLTAKENYFELPQAFFMRIAMGLAIDETNKEARAIEFYEMLSSLKFLPNIATLANSAKPNAQLVSNFCLTAADNLDDIFTLFKTNALITKYDGHSSNDWSGVRAKHTPIKTTNYLASGVIPFIQTASHAAELTCHADNKVNANLAIWHRDIEDFLNLTVTSAAFAQTVWIPDLFIKRLTADEDWTLFSPDEAPGLHALYGRNFEQTYLNYEQLVENNKLPHSKRVKATAIWNKLVASLVSSTNDFAIAFQEPCNLRSPQQHLGTVHHTSHDLAVCLTSSTSDAANSNLGTINLAAHIIDKKLDENTLRDSIQTAIRLLDNTLTLSSYPNKSSEKYSINNRCLGIGIIGLVTTLNELGIECNSTTAVEFVDNIIELISYLTIEASNQLAIERGRYENYNDSLWSQNIFPIDSQELLKETRGDDLSINNSSQLDWQQLRNQVNQHGLRNANLLAIAEFLIPAAISNVDSAISAANFHPAQLIEIATRCQKWTDQSVAITLPRNDLNSQEIAVLLKDTWQKGLKGIRSIKSIAQ